MIAPAGVPRRLRVAPPVVHPLLLVLEPTMTGWPWKTLAPRAAATLQVMGLPDHVHDPGVRATLGWAVLHEDVQVAVICKEAAGPPWEDARAALARMAEPLAAMLTLTAPRAPAPEVNALWFDTVARRLHTLGRDPRTGTLREDAEPSLVLRGLLDVRELRR